MVCQTKDGPGGSFSDGSFTEINGKKHDKEWAAVQPGTGTIGLSWTQFDTYGTSDTTCKSTILYSESDDQGNSWSTPVVITEQREVSELTDKVVCLQTNFSSLLRARYPGSMPASLKI